MAVAAVLVWGYLFFGVIDLLVAIDQTPGFYDSYLLETGWGLLYTVLVAGAFVALAIRPGLTMPLIQVTSVGAAVGVTAIASGSLGQLVPAVLLMINAAFAADLARGYVRPPGGWRRPTFDLPLLVLAAPLTVAGVVYAADMVVAYRTGRPPTDDITWHLDHWPMQAALSVGLALTALGTAVGVRNRWSGTAVSASCVAVTAAWFGITCVVYPHHAASVGQTRGAAVAVWAVLYVLLTAERLVRQAKPAAGVGQPHAK